LSKWHPGQTGDQGVQERVWMGVFTVVRPGAALVSRISEMLVSYRWAPTIGPLSYLVQITDAGSTPCSTTKQHRSRQRWRLLCLCARQGASALRWRSSTRPARGRG